MKNVLLATTALVATAGVASAEVAISGYAEMGILGGDRYATTQFHTDIDVTFSMSGEADNGLSFGASIDLDESDGSGLSTSSPAFGNTTQGGETIWISYGGFKLTMGDTDGALDAAMTEVGIGGAIADDHTSHAGYNGNSGFDGTYDGQIATFQYSASSFTGYMSVEIDDTGTLDPVWGLGVKFSTDLGGTTVGVGLGYQTRDDAFAYDEMWGLSLNATFANGLQAVVNYSQASGSAADDLTHWALGLGYSMNALTIGVNYGEYEIGNASTSGFGLAVNYDLGGGLVAQMGYGSSDLGALGDTNQWSLGLAMSF